MGKLERERGRCGRVKKGMRIFCIQHYISCSCCNLYVLPEGPSNFRR